MLIAIRAATNWLFSNTIEFDMVRHCAIWLLVFSSVYLGAQTPKYPVISLPVVRNGVNLTNAWTGGFDAPEFSSADINGDGIKDLFVFDRSGNKVMVFINGGANNDTTFHYAPEYEHLFPPLTTWAVLRDYNGDGVLGNLHFDIDQYCLYYKDTPYTINLVPNSNGVPAFVDVNHDGALDMLTFDIYGSTGVYYENIAAQLGLPADSMVFSLVSACWGNFYVSGNTLDVQLGVSCKGGAPYNPQGNERHTGATLWPVEYGNDDNVDVLVSGAHISNMIFMKNTGTADNADIGWVDTIWPRCSMPVNSPLFPAAFQIDGNNDGHNDLLIAPNFGYPNPAMNTNNVQFYQRVSGDTCEQYNGNDTFLVHTMLDFGSDSKVALFDYNGDSLMDLVVGNLFYYDPVVAAVSRLALYQNIGTPTQPKFREESTDYMGLSAYNLVGIYPAFGDLDGDGKKDMLIGDANGDIDFFKNVGSGVASFPAMNMSSYFGINVGANAAPFIYDVNNDGLPDLVIGKNYGTLSYYWNFGSLTHPLFSVDSVDSTFGHVNVVLASATAGNSQPFIMRDSHTGALLLFVGSAQGLVYEYEIDTTHLRNGNFTLLDSNFLQHTVGANATMQAYDLNGDGKMEYVTGCSRGGLQLFSETVWDSSVILSDKTIEPVNNNIRVFPNPANEQLKCVLPEPPGTVIQPQVFNLLGQRMEVGFTIGQNTLTFNTQGLVSGMYVFRVMVGEQLFLVKAVVEH